MGRKVDSQKKEEDAPTVSQIFDTFRADSEGIVNLYWNSNWSLNQEASSDCAITPALEALKAYLFLLLNLNDHLPVFEILHQVIEMAKADSKDNEDTIQYLLPGLAEINMAVATYVLNAIQQQQEMQQKARAMAAHQGGGKGDLWTPQLTQP